MSEADLFKKAIELHHVKKLDVKISGAQVAHPTAGYRLWQGHIESCEPIVAMAIIEGEGKYSWVRCSSPSMNVLETRIQYSPYDEYGKDVSVSFGIDDSIVHDRCVLESGMSQPHPMVGNYKTGELIKISEIVGESTLVLWAIILAKQDVVVGRSRIWHLKVDQKDMLDEKWRDVFTFGRSGIIEK